MNSPWDEQFPNPANHVIPEPKAPIKLRV